MLHSIRTASSDKFQELLVDLPADKRVEIVDASEQLRRDTLETLEDKFSYTDHIPWNGIGAFYAEQGGTISEAKACLTQAIQEYDNAVRDGHEKQIDRVSHLLYAQGKPCRNDIDKFLADPGDKSLKSYPHL